MRTSYTSNTSIIATKRWNEFKSKVLLSNDPKLTAKLDDSWGKVLGFISKSFHR